MDYKLVRSTDSEDENQNEGRKKGESENEGTDQPSERKMLFGYPAQVFFILGNEFCERFSYNGIHTILVLYLVTMLKMEKSDATIVYHAFNLLCYFSPIIGNFTTLIPRIFSLTHTRHRTTHTRSTTIYLFFL